MGFEKFGGSGRLVDLWSDSILYNIRLDYEGRAE